MGCVRTVPTLIFEFNFCDIRKITETILSFRSSSFLKQPFSRTFYEEKVSSTSTELSPPFEFCVFGILADVGVERLAFSGNLEILGNLQSGREKNPPTSQAGKNEVYLLRD